MLRLIDTIRGNNVHEIYRVFQGLDLLNTVEAVTFTGPVRVGNILARYPLSAVSLAAQGRAVWGSVDVSFICAAILRHWKVSLAPSQTPPPSATVSAAIAQVGTMRAEPPRAGIILLRPSLAITTPLAHSNGEIFEYLQFGIMDKSSRATMN